MKEEIGSEFWIDDVANESNDIYHDFKENGFGGVYGFLSPGRTPAAAGTFAYGT